MDPCRDVETVRVMIQRALVEVQQDEWETIRDLQLCASAEVYDAVQQLCQSARPSERVLGVDILGQFGVRGKARPFDEPIRQLLLTMLDREADLEVLIALATALGHLQESRAIEPLCRLKDHADADLRQAVVFGLQGQEDARAVEALIDLSQDAAVDVRSWATFALGSQIEMDTEAIRDALLRNIDDEDEETREEALAGLAMRRDRRILERALADLASGAVEADFVVGEAFCEMLDALKDEISHELLAAALEQCNGVE